ncbi:hypothetical protein HYU09_05560 [Candidatus Woesearchaeota archaeon]|nr:hypothetical protein [Candidatus Woesearchaeota archaeon]
MVKIKIDAEKAFLALFFAVFLFFGPGILFDHRVSHDFPYAYFASDSFQHQVRAEAIKDAGDFRYEAAYISKGLEDVVGRYPPAIYHIAVILSYASGIEVYDSIYFAVVFFAVISAFVMYIIIRDFNKAIAVLSLPLSLLIFSSPISTGFLWGHWPSILSQSFLVLLFWSIMRIDIKKSYMLIGLLLSAVALTHTSEAIFGILFLALFFGVKLFAKKLARDDIKSMALAFIIFSVISFYYMVIFFGTWAKAQPYSFAIEPVWEGNPGFYIAGFGLLLIPIIFGLIFSLPKLKNLHVSLILALVMLAAGFLNYAGFQLRSFQIRFFWPIYLSVFFGLGIYILFGFIVKKWNSAYAASVSAVMLILFLGIISLPQIAQTDVQAIPSIPQLNQESKQGIMNPFNWESLDWLSKNTEKESDIYFFYGDIYSQDALLRNSKRTHYQVDPEDFIKALQERKIKKEYMTETPGDTGGSISIRESFFKLKEHPDASLPEFGFGPKNICNFDYYVFDKVSREEVLAQYNMLIAQELLKKGYIKPVFENQAVVILKNNDVGADCIEERSF